MEGFTASGELIDETLSEVNQIKVPNDIKNHFLRETKNPAMCIYELVQRFHLEIEFVSASGDAHFMYGCYCVLSGKRFPTGYSSKKKGAKLEAARLAMGLLVERHEDTELGNCLPLFTAVNCF